MYELKQLKDGFNKLCLATSTHPKAITGRITCSPWPQLAFFMNNGLAPRCDAGSAVGSELSVVISPQIFYDSECKTESHAPL